ncbi:expressed unknown protein [Seminavis robusta]|uniref:MYND-type domain-containing protein n=1 Tax=Seminavis robusta TaxID=568900 RepID=A0A9N8DYV7_9STRA|nr:expressed unknown protein [Seminavis robusta]|eukprot:Sro351_g124040.1 n/a (197) ;mRNA; f:65146-65736
MFTCLPCSASSSNCFGASAGNNNKSVYLDVYAGTNCPKMYFSKTDVAQDGCTVICRNSGCYKIGTHRCAACEHEAYCCEVCRQQDRKRHEEDCRRYTTTVRVEQMKNFNRQASCRGRGGCSNTVVSFCRHCQATVCHQWQCSKIHLEQCNAYLEAKLEREWVRIDLLVKKKNDSCRQEIPQNRGGNDNEAWVLVDG